MKAEIKGRSGQREPPLLTLVRADVISPPARRARYAPKERAGLLGRPGACLARRASAGLAAGSRHVRRTEVTIASRATKHLPRAEPDASARGIAQAGSAACPTDRRRESNHAPAPARRDRRDSDVAQAQISSERT